MRPRPLEQYVLAHASSKLAEGRSNTYHCILSAADALDSVMQEFIRDLLHTGGPLLKIRYLRVHFALRQSSSSSWKA